MSAAYCLGADAIKTGLDLLSKEKIHPVVALFLDIAHYKTLHKIDAGESVDAKLSELCKNYAVPYGPADKPLLIPFKDRNAKGVKGLFRNGNIAGSFAKSSIRSDDSRQSLTTESGNFCYPQDAESFLNEKLGGVKLLTWAVAAFYLRNAIFVFDDGVSPSASDLVSVFKSSYGLDGLSQFDDSTDNATDALFIPAEDSLDDSLAPETLNIGPSGTVRLYPGQRKPELYASDIVDGFEDPRDKGFINLAEKMLTEFGGVVLVGPPGTSKSYSAQEIANDLTGGNEANQFYVQFHSSYQYEDFMEGFRPTKNGGFVRKEGVFLQACHRASEVGEEKVVLTIDEISRADIGRVFGEALTYIEANKRNNVFLLPSGMETSVPRNLMIIATMNSLDRGANDIDEAFGRRFAFIDVPPSVDLLDEVLADDADQSVKDNIKSWMKEDLDLSKDEPRAAVGHAFFVGIRNDFDAKRRWNYQLKRYLQHVLSGRPEILSQLIFAWEERFPYDGE